MSNAKLTDKAAFETLIRGGRRTNKVEWVSAPGQDDRDALNAAIRKAAGRGEQEPGDESYPWKSLQDGDKRDSGDTR
jgi:hypothetical protein